MTPEKLPNGTASLQDGLPTKRGATVLSGSTDRTRWRLLDEKGRHTWHYLQSDEEVKKWPQSTADKYFLNLPTVCSIQMTLPIRRRGN